MVLCRIKLLPQTGWLIFKFNFQLSYKLRKWSVDWFWSPHPVNQIKTACQITISTIANYIINRISQLSLKLLINSELANWNWLRYPFSVYKSIVMLIYYINAISVSYQIIPYVMLLLSSLNNIKFSSTVQVIIIEGY